MSITRDSLQWEITVLGINSHRRPAKEAVLLYQEEQHSIDQRLAQIAEQKQQRAFLPHAEREYRPNKKQRRQIHRFKQG